MLSCHFTFAQTKEKAATTVPNNTSSLQYKNPPALFDPTPFGFNHSVAVESPLKMCFISGQSGGVGTNHELSNDFRQQVIAALNNLKIVLNQNSMTLNDVVKITLLIADHNPERLAIWSEEAKKVWKSSNLPTSTLIPVSQLALPNMMFEIDAVAIQKM